MEDWEIIENRACATIVHGFSKPPTTFERIGIKHQSSPRPLGYCGVFARLVGPRGGALVSKFWGARGSCIYQLRGHTRAFNTHVISYPNITTQRILLEKRADWLICQGWEKIVGGCKAFYACISSLLIKLELHSEIGSYRRESTFLLVIESSFC